MIIRPEKRAEFSSIHELVKTAFQTAKVSCGDEQNFVLRLRESENYIPELALVAEDKAALIGHIMLTRTEVKTETGAFPLLLLGPLSVVLERRGQGVGGALLQDGCRRATALGYKAVILVGDPAYYQRFGFESAETVPIENVNGIPAPYVLVRELGPGALAKAKGRIEFQT